jgi:hypothetical protein
MYKAVIAAANGVGMNDRMDPELRDEEVHRMEQEIPTLHPGLTNREIRPTLTDDEYKKLKGCYLLPEHGPTDIEPNVRYYTRDKDGEHVKFLLLKNVLVDSYIPAKIALEEATWKVAGRTAATGQPNPKKITYGWFRQLPGHIEGSDFESLRTRPTLSQPGLAHGLRPMVRAMNDLLKEYLSEYYPKVLEDAMKALRREDEVEAKYLAEVRNNPESPFPEKDVAKLKGMDMMGWVPEMATYTLWATVFSTLELNKHIVFRAHEDAYNADGTLVCISAVGDWVGGRLILPRYGYGADLAPTDLLICDNHSELHGNLGPLVGNQKSPRFSVVAFLHSHLFDYAQRKGLWTPKDTVRSDV